MSSLLGSTLNARALPTGDMRYIRSDCPDRLTDREVAWLRQSGVTTVVDLREEAECALKPCRLAREPGFTYHRLPVTGGGGTPPSPEAVAEVYLGMLDAMMDRIIDTIMGSDGSVLYFCGAGKDRTGVVSAVLLSRLGFDDQTILNDYMLTRENLLEPLTAYVRTHPEVELSTILPNEQNLRKVLEVLHAREAEHPGELRFRAMLRRNGDMDAAYVVVPYDIRARFGKGRLLAEATLDGIPYRGQVVRMGTPYYLIGVPKAIRKQLGRSFGDTIAVTIRERA